MTADKSSQARAKAGRQGGKVPAFDPAAAPLGTDAEAAGDVSPAEPIPDRADLRSAQSNGGAYPRLESAYATTLGSPRSLVVLSCCAAIATIAVVVCVLAYR